MGKIQNFFKFSIFVLSLSIVFGFTSQSFASNDGREGNEYRDNDYKSSLCNRDGDNWWNRSGLCDREDRDGNKKGKKPLVYLFATKYSIKAGTSTTMYWDAKRADSCSVSGSGWSGDRAVKAKESVSPLVTTNYTVTCTNEFGSYTDSAEITVKKSKATTTPPSLPTVDLNASPLTIYNGASSTLSWVSNNATTCAATVGWSGNKVASSSQIVSPTATTTYTLTCSGAGGSANDSVTVGVWATSTPPVETESPTLTFTGLPLSITQGASSTLTWTSTNTNFCLASGGWLGSKLLSGNQEVSPSATTTYTLACGGGGSTTTQSVIVDVNAPVVVPPTTLTHLIISEVYYDVGAGKGDSSDNEWIEVYNGTGSSVDISNWVIADVSAEFDIIPPGSVIPNLGFAVITASSTTSGFWGSVPVISLDTARLGNALGNAGDTIYLKNSASTTVDSMSYGTVAIEAFTPTAPDVVTGHSLKKNALTVSNGATYWSDLLTPTPGSF